MLYWLAILTGVAGLFAGGAPLVKYAMQRWRDPAFDFYYNFGYIATAANTFILSTILLIFVHISYVIQRGFRATSKKPGASGKQPREPSLPANSISQAAGTSKEQQAGETPDEKLARLINVKKE